MAKKPAAKRPYRPNGYTKPYKPTGAAPPPKVQRKGKRTVLPSGSIRVRRTRRQGEGKYRLHRPHWIDPYPNIVGTEPEKQFFAALIQRGIYFIFHGGSPATAALVSIAEPDRDIDFLLPEYRVIIDPYSPFAHSQPSSIARDAEKAAVFAAAGYTTYHPWALAPGVYLFDEQPMQVGTWTSSFSRYIGRHKSVAPAHVKVYGAMAALDAMPLLRAGPRYPLTDPLDIAARRHPGYRIGPHYGAGANGVALANYARRRPPKLSLKS